MLRMVTHNFLHVKLFYQAAKEGLGFSRISCICGTVFITSYLSNLSGDTAKKYFS